MKPFLAAGLLALSFPLSARAECDLAKATKDNPCSLRELLWFAETEERESQALAKMAEMPATEHNMLVTERVVKAQKKLIAFSKGKFGDLCASWKELSEKLAAVQLKYGKAPDGLTSEELYRYVGKPEAEVRKAERGAELKVWEWKLNLTLTGPAYAAISFGRTRPDGPWTFVGCSWCEKDGCIDLPWAP